MGVVDKTLHRRVIKDIVILLQLHVLKVKTLRRQTVVGGLVLDTTQTQEKPTRIPYVTPKVIVIVLTIVGPEQDQNMNGVTVSVDFHTEKE